MVWVSFARKLQEFKLDVLLVNNTWFKIKPRNYERVEAIVNKILEERLSVYIDPDCDPDGLFCGKIFKTMFDRLGYTKYTIGKHYFKRHVLTMEYARSLIEKKYDVVFLLDSSTNSLDVLNLLSANGVIVIVVDHHEPDYHWRDYPENVYLVNPCMEVAEPLLIYPELQDCVKKWAEQGKAIFVKELNRNTPSISRDALLSIFRTVGYTNFKIGFTVDDRCDCILLLDDRDSYRTDYKEIVILSSSKDLIAHGVKVLYPEVGVNTSAVLYKELSCGALCALVCDYVLSKHGFKDNNDLYVMGYVTLYSDVCSLNNTYNAAFLKKFRDDSLSISDTIRFFMSQYDFFNRSFVSYRMVPRLNALIRTEHFELLYDVFFNAPSDTQAIQTLMNQIEDVYIESKEYAHELESSCKIYEDWEGVVVGILPKGIPDRARNYTGLVASYLAERANTLALCLYQKNDSMYAGSARDPFGRDARSMLSNMCHAAGHPPAFGVEVEINRLRMVCNVVDSYFEEGHRDVIIVKWDDSMPMSAIQDDIQLMAEYNEYGGQGIPSAYAFFKITKDCRIKQEAKRSLVLWRGLRFVVFASALQVGDVLAVQPCLKGPRVELLVKNVGYDL